MDTVKYLSYLTIAALLLTSCRSKIESEAPVTDEIIITSQQFATDSMELGHIQTRVFENTLKCNGRFVPMPNGMARLSAMVPGIIKSINCHNGQFIGKDQKLAEITGTEVFDMQKDFAEAASVYNRLKTEFERIKALYDEKVTSEKDFMAVESEYKTAMAKYFGLKLKLEAVGFSTSNIEKGEFYSTYALQSPIDGYVSDIKTRLGDYVDQHSTIIEITDPNRLQLHLAVFPQDISAIRKGQTVRINNAKGKNTNLATVSSVGVAIDNDTRTIDCYAALTGNKNIDAVANTYVEAEIVTGTDSVYALPVDAIVKTENGYVVLALNKKDNEKYYFDKKVVNIGRQYNGLYEILNGKVDGEIVVNGLYNISL